METLNTTQVEKINSLFKEMNADLKKGSTPKQLHNKLIKTYGEKFSLGIMLLFNHTINN